MALWGILSNRSWSSDGSNESVCEVSRMKLWRSLSLAATAIFMLGTTKIKKWGSSYVEQAQQFSSPCCRRGNGMPFRCLELMINSFSLTAFSSRRLQLRWVWSSGASSSRLSTSDWLQIPVRKPRYLEMKRIYER